MQIAQQPGTRLSSPRCASIVVKRIQGDRYKITRQNHQVGMQTVCNFDCPVHRSDRKDWVIMEVTQLGNSEAVERARKTSQRHLKPHQFRVVRFANYSVFRKYGRGKSESSCKQKLPAVYRQLRLISQMGCDV
jgi:hypothetical protein